jgi:hypothetical protein
MKDEQIAANLIAFANQTQDACLSVTLKAIAGAIMTGETNSLLANLEPWIIQQVQKISN